MLMQNWTMNRVDYTLTWCGFWKSKVKTSRNALYDKHGPVITTLWLDMRSTRFIVKGIKIWRD